MALFALRCSMHADQWETGQVVVEKDTIVPAFFVVTGVALLALLTLVYIVSLVAGDAVCFHLIFLDFTLVAVVT